MTKKIDKIHRQQVLLNQLNKDIYNKEQFMAKFHIRERTIRRDLNELAEKGEIYQDRLAILRKKCLGKLTKKVYDDKLSDDLMVKLVISGEPKRIEAQSIEEIRELKVHVFRLDETKIRREHQ